MSELAKTTRMCPNGHVLEPGWEVCPYCPSTRMISPPLAPTIRIPDVAPRAAAELARKTELLRPPLAQEAVAWLVATAQEKRGQVLRIDRPRTTVGAGDSCELVIDEPHVSGRHATLRFAEGRFALTDLGSSNGTWVNDEEIDERELSDGDRIRFGSSEWIFKCVVFGD